MLSQDLNAENASKAQVMLTAKTKIRKDLNWFLANVELFDVANSLNKQLAAKLLFELFDPNQDLN